MAPSSHGSAVPRARRPVPPRDGTMKSLTSPSVQTFRPTSVCLAAYSPVESSGMGVPTTQARNIPGLLAVEAAVLRIILPLPLYSLDSHIEGFSSAGGDPPGHILAEGTSPQNQLGKWPEEFSHGFPRGKFESNPDSPPLHNSHSLFSWGSEQKPVTQKMQNAHAVLNGPLLRRTPPTTQPSSLGRQRCVVFPV